MANENRFRVRYGEVFWRAHHEAWQQSTLNQREYCEAHRISLKAFGNWRAKFTAEPLPPAPKLRSKEAQALLKLSAHDAEGLSRSERRIDRRFGPMIRPG